MDRLAPTRLTRRPWLPLAAALLVFHPSAQAQEVRVRVEITGVDRDLKKNIEALIAIATAAKSGRRRALTL